LKNESGQLPTDMWDTKLVPLLDLFDVLGRRWALRVVWELCETSATFRVLLDRAAPISSSVLTDRLRELRKAGVVDHQRSTGYCLTDLGKGVADRIIDMYWWLKERPDWPPPGQGEVSPAEAVGSVVAVATPKRASTNGVISTSGVPGSSGRKSPAAKSPAAKSPIAKSPIAKSSSRKR
jgi:DNA-binding HxlR family transcriptional regulator